MTRNRWQQPCLADGNGDLPVELARGRLPVVSAGWLYMLERPARLPESIQVALKKKTRDVGIKTQMLQETGV